METMYAQGVWCLIHELTRNLANMKVITSIYLNCRPDLRDEWLTGTEADDVGDAQVSAG
jgi:hypothetical protein